MRNYGWIVLVVALAGGAVWYFASGNPTSETEDTGYGDVEPITDQAPALEGRDTGGAIAAAGGTRERGRYSIAGRVEHPDGKPVAGVAVSLHMHRQDWRRPRAFGWQLQAERVGTATDWSPIESTTTDAKGGFTFTGLKQKSYKVRAVPTAPLYPVERWAWLNTGLQHKMTLVVEPGVPLRVRAVDGNGDGIAATLRAGLARADGINWSQSDIATDASGRYTFASVPKGDLTLAVGVRGLGWRHGIPVTTPQEGEVLLRFEPPNGGTVEGTVSDTAGAPVAGARVSVYTSSTGSRAQHTHRVTTSRDDGTYRVSGLVPGKISTLQAVARGFVGVERAAPSRSVPPGGTVTVNLTMVRGGVIEGVVTTPDGATVADVDIRAQATRRGNSIYTSTASAVGDAQGRYTLRDVPLGPGTLRISAPGHYIDRTDAAPAPSYEIKAEGEHHELDIVMHRGTPVSGRVVDVDGAPVVGAAIELTKGAANQLHWADRQVHTDDEGRFAFVGLAPSAAWQIVASAETGLSEPQVLAVEAHTPITDLELILRPGATIRGRVEVDGGPPNGAMRVHLNTKAGHRIQNRTNQTVATAEGGVFEITALPAGEYALHTVDHHHSACGEPITVSVDWGQALEDVVLVSERLGKLAAQIVDAEGKPLAQVQLSIRANTGSQSWHTSAQTDAKGRFALSSLREADYQIFVGDTEIGTLKIDEADARLVYEGASADDAPAVFEGKVTGPDGKPVAGGRVTIYQVSQNMRRGHTGQITAGEFRVEIKGLSDEAHLDLRVEAATDLLGRPLNVKPLLQERIKVGGRFDLQLTEGLVIRGEVVDTEGAPVPGISLSMYASSRSSPYGSHHAEVKSDQEGRFEFTGLSEGDYNLNLRVFGDWVPPLQTMASAGDTDVRIVLLQGVTVSGTAMDAAGAPVVNATAQMNWTVEIKMNGQVMQQGRSAQGQTDANGKFVIRGVPNDVKGSVRIHPPGGNDGTLLPGVVNDVLAGAQDVAVRLAEGVRIAGTLVGPEGEAVPNAMIMCRVKQRTPGGGHGHYHARVEGKAFSIGPLPPGAYVLTFHIHGEHSAPDEMEVVAPAKDLRIVAPKGTPIKGTIEGKLSGHLTVTFIEMTANGPQSTGSGSSGRKFLIPRKDDSPGTIFIREQNGSRYALVENARPSNGPYTLTLREGLSISGRVDVKIDKQFGGHVTAKSDLGFYANAQVKSDGTFIIKGLPPGTYHLMGWSGSGRFEELNDIKAGSEGLVLKVASK